MITHTILKLIEYNTTRGEKNAVKALFDFIESFLGTEHFDFEYIEHNNFLSVIICFKGRDWKTEKIIINGHADVVPGHDHQFIPYVEGDHLYGRGAVDMKGSIAVMIHTLKALSQQNIKPSVACIITSDEELGGAHGAEYICKNYDFFSEFVLVPDGPRHEKIEITNREKGIMWLKLEACGKTSHASRPWLGVNAHDVLIDSISHVKHYFKVHNTLGWNTTVSVTYMHTENSTYNKIPDHSEAVLDMRFTEHDALHPDELLSKIQSILPETVTATTLVTGAPVYTPEDNTYIQTLKQSFDNVTHGDMVISYSDAGHDARFFAGKGIPTALIGPVGAHWHGEDEWVSLESLYIMKDALIHFLSQYA